MRCALLYLGEACLARSTESGKVSGELTDYNGTVICDVELGTPCTNNEGHAKQV